MKIRTSLIALSLFCGFVQGDELSGYPHYVIDLDDSKISCLEAKQYPEAHYILYRICISKDFSSLAKNIAAQAFERFVERLLDPKVYECFKKSTTNSKELALETRDTYLKRWVFPALGTRTLTAGSSTAVTNALVFISALSKSPDLLVEGYLNFFNDPTYVAEGRPWRKHISIAANKDLLGSESVPFGNDVVTWASLFSVAYFKNMGLREDILEAGIGANQQFSKCIFTGGAEQ